MPLSEKVRIEVFLPDAPHAAYGNLLAALEQELTHNFGGCSLVRGLEGSYLSRLGAIMRDRVNLLFCDVPFQFESNFSAVSRYADELHNAVLDALDEEAILISEFPVYHVE